MKFEKACYSMSLLMECIEDTKRFTMTVTRKNQYFAKYMELNAIYEKAEKLNSILFDAEYYLKDFRNASHNYKVWSKKELHEMMKIAVRHLQWELTSIYNDIQKGELDYCE